MNQGFAAAILFDWLLFWGSDDRAASPTVLADAMAFVESLSPSVPIPVNCLPDMIVCAGRYFDYQTGALGRFSCFFSQGLFLRSAYYRALLFGCTPPHQATLFGLGARQRLASYDPGFRLSGDLNYFLQLSRYPGLRVQCLDLELVHMADGGVSGQQTQRRLQEVHRAYRRAFGWYWWFPFLMRYLRRVTSLFAWSR